MSQQDGLDTMALTIRPKRVTLEMVSVGTVLVKTVVKAPRIDSGRYSHISDSRGRY